MSTGRTQIQAHPEVCSLKHLIFLPEGLRPFSAWGRKWDGGEVRCGFVNDSQVQVF